MALWSCRFPLASYEKHWVIKNYDHSLWRALCNIQNLFHVKKKKKEKVQFLILQKANHLTIFKGGGGSIYRQFIYSDERKLSDQEKGYKQLFKFCTNIQKKEVLNDWAPPKSQCSKVSKLLASVHAKKIHLFKKKANHFKVITNRCVSNRKIRKKGFGLPSGIAGAAHSFSASSSSVSRVWDGSSVKAPLECPLQVYIIYFLFPEVSGSGHWPEEGGGSKQWIQLVAADWDENLIQSWNALQKVKYCLFRCSVHCHIRLNGLLYMAGVCSID